MATEMVGDPRFFARVGPHSLAIIAQAAGIAAPAGWGEPRYNGVAPLQTAGPAEVSFLDNRRYVSLLGQTRAGAVILAGELASSLPPTCAPLISPTPYLAWAKVCTLFYPPAALAPGAHPTALIDPTARVDPTASIGAFATIGVGAEIGAHCRIEAQVVLGAGIVLGAGCTIGAGASLTHAILGERVRIFPGARIGQDGFGFAPDGQGGFVTVPQLGRVLIGHDVEIGANTTIDRGSMHDTVIGAGTRIDNLVQIGHNVRCGRGCVIVAQAGISGSTILEDHVMAGGQAGLAGHLHVGRNARIAAQSGVMADIPAGASVMGSPSQPSATHLREIATLRRLVRRSPAAPPVAGVPGSAPDHPRAVQE